MSRSKRILLYLMAAFYVFAGYMHFAKPDFYMPMIPPYLAWHVQLVFLSGVAEVICGIGLLVPSMRRLAAWGTIALLIAVFPANLHIALNNVPLGKSPEGLGIWNWVRLPFQLVLIAWAWWYTRREREPVGELATRI
ncbi:MAG: DoxX family protein [Deltaproteobacteria bacterium]|nr:DoxX family protein [Deltaproteobacteria bacterium]